MAPLLRPTVASQGALSTAAATTEPRPRLTKISGSVQQTSVVSDDASPMKADSFARTDPPIRDVNRRLRRRFLNQQVEVVEMWRIVRSLERRDRRQAGRDHFEDWSFWQDRDWMQVAWCDGTVGGKVLTTCVPHRPAAVVWCLQAGAREVGLLTARHDGNRRQDVGGGAAQCQRDGEERKKARTAAHATILRAPVILINYRAARRYSR